MSHRNALLVWAEQAAKQSGHGPLLTTSKLFGEGPLDSSHALDLILLIEELRGQEVREEELRPEAFRDIDTICERFFGETR